jgi:LPPG:FO 2-phospho-L-lactate transferase
MADACLATIGVETAADAVAQHYGSRASGGVLDAWLLAEEDAALSAAVSQSGIRASVVPLWMRDIPTSSALAAASLAAAL